jgi:hypothetical protein
MTLSEFRWILQNYCFNNIVIGKTMHSPLVFPGINGESAVMLLSPSQSSFKKPVDKMRKSLIQTQNQKCFKDRPEPVASAKNMVAFVKRVKVKMIQSHKLYSEAEFDASWYSDDEYATIKNTCTRTLRQMMITGFEETEEYCPRGLEVRTKQYSTARKQVRFQATMAVLEEQETEVKGGTEDEERIRVCYLEVSAEAGSRAHFQGLADAKVARQYVC